MNERVLIVDDEASVHEVARAYLEREGFLVSSAFSGGEALTVAAGKQPSVVVLDRGLPDLEGDDVLQRLRSRSDVAVIMLTARAAEEERLHGFALGADDYLTKPFSPRELVARVKALVRRTGGGETPLVDRLVFDAGRLRIDTVQHRVLVDGRDVDLTRSEYRLLVALAQYPGRAYSRFELISRVQGYEYEGYERTIDAHVKNLRRKIERDPVEPRYILTVRGVGYRLGVERE